MTSKEGEAPEMMNRYKAAMVLAGAGDALGYRMGNWEFCHSGPQIHSELRELGGLQKVKVDKRNWPVSDDTVMHLATAEALIERSGDPDKEKMYCEIARHYQKCMHDMAGRAAGVTCSAMTAKLRPNIKQGYQIPFNTRGGGCGAAMRAMCIGLRYPRPEDIQDLVAVSIESGRMTHHHPTGYLGSLASALFTAYAIQGKMPIESWAAGLLEVIEKDAKPYLSSSDHFPEENLRAMGYFLGHWEDYIKLRQLDSGEAHFPDNYTDPSVRDKFYKEISFGGWGGASGHDSTIIAYDALLGAKVDWEQLGLRGMFHGGDSDSTGTIAACWYGALYGFKGVPENNYKKLEYRERIEKVAQEIFSLASDQYSKKKELISKPQSENSEEDSKRSPTVSASGVSAESEHAMDTDQNGGHGSGDAGDTNKGSGAGTTAMNTDAMDTDKKDGKVSGDTGDTNKGSGAGTTVVNTDAMDTDKKDGQVSGDAGETNQEVESIRTPTVDATHASQEDGHGDAGDNNKGSGAGTTAMNTDAMDTDKKDGQVSGDAGDTNKRSGATAMNTAKNETAADVVTQEPTQEPSHEDKKETAV